VCASWWETFQDRPITAGTLFADVLKEKSLLLTVWAGRSHTAAMQRVGHALARNRDRIYGAWALRAAGQDAHTKNAAYRLEKVPVKHPKHPTHPVHGDNPIAEQQVAAHDGSGVLPTGDTKTPRNTPETPQNTLQTTIRNNGDYDNDTGVSGVSGVLQAPLLLGATKIPPVASGQGDPPVSCPRCQRRATIAHDGRYWCCNCVAYV
jgi:hypothetical protein